QLQLISETASGIVDRQASCFLDKVLPAFEEAGIKLDRWDDLASAERTKLHTYFREQVFPVLTPLAVDPAHPFPYISGLSLNLAVSVEDPATGQEHFARVKVPPLLPRFVEGEPGRYVPVEDVIAAHLELLFPGMEILDS